MKTMATALPDVMIIEPARFGDAGGRFSKTWNADRMAAAGLNLAFVQDNHSFSATKGTLRGLHYQSPPRAQDKMVRCSRGAILAVAVDVRRGSPAYGIWTGVELSPKNGRQLFVPKGFLHGFVTLTDNTEWQYKCTDLYAPDCDGAVHFASLGVHWGIYPASSTLSDKYACVPYFTDWTSPFTYGAL